MKYYVLASGSRGNCTIIDINGKLLMIDVGININEIDEKLNSLGYQESDIGAILITHDHGDHIRAISHFSNDIIYAGNIDYNVKSENKLIPFETYNILGVKVTPLPLSHDSGVCYGYRIEYDNQVMVYVTDTGYFSSKLISYTLGADYYIFESNHNVRMLMQTKRPMFIKERIISDSGHLSNEDSAFILSKLLTENTKEIVLAHISQQANTKELACETFYKICKKNNVDVSNIKLLAADQYQITSPSLEIFKEVVNVN